MAHTHCWIEYTLLYLGGVGHQPYETLGAVGAHFMGGQYVQNGVYYGLLSGTDDQCRQAVRSMAAFAAREVTTDELSAIIYQQQPINTPILTPDNLTFYLGPVIFNDDGEVTRELSDTEWSAPVVPTHIGIHAPDVLCYST